MNDKKQLSIKIELLLHGVRMQYDYELYKRPLIDSISDGLFLIIGQQIYITASLNTKSSNIIYPNNGKLYINILGENLTVEILSPPSFLGLKTKDGTLFENVGAFQIDRLRISAYKGCYYDIQDCECKFCEVGGKKKQRKNILENIRELVLYTEEK